MREGGRERGREEGREEGRKNEKRLPCSKKAIGREGEKEGRKGTEIWEYPTRRLLAARINLVPCPSQSRFAMYQLRSSSKSAPGTKRS